MALSRPTGVTILAVLQLTRTCGWTASRAGLVLFADWSDRVSSCLGIVYP